ncbi:MAG TPA: AAA family ATPase [Polyangiaceae bacterium]|jgi:predicted ATPase/HPt (histidine-containing phosphotransfer) domain-containing protein
MRLERYAVGETIARSTRTIVRRARRVADGASVVIKTPSREYPTVRELSQLEFEHRILNKVAMPGVVRAIELERESGRLALVLEDFGGEPLPSGPMTLGHFFTTACEVARLLGEVHAKNVIHKDVNPKNVLMNPSTRVIKLIDFSLASELNREHLDLAPTTQLEGTLPYVSPEQTGRMNRDLDYRTDYYSLGVTLFELLTGKLPFVASDVLGYVHCHISKPAPDPRELRDDVPEGLAQIVAKLMAKNPDERYQSIRGLLHDLGRCRQQWQETGEAPAFALGAADVSERFQVSQKLVGREDEGAAMLSMFEAACRGPASLLLVAGYSGVGKSSLIREIHKPVVDKRATFIEGKFDQLERHSPYGVWIQALRGFVKQVLAEPEEHLLSWRQRLVAALGANGNVVVNLVPELEQVIGPQPAVPDLPAREAQGRTQRVFRDLIKAMATSEHPLVIFFDDLQWSDDSTPQLLVDLLCDEEIRHVLVIGAYRDNEVPEDHPLRAAIADLTAKRPGALRQMQLLALSEATLNQLVADTLHCDPSASRPLAARLFQKTAGNPFFLNEALAQLHREGAVRFAAEQGCWTWDDDKVSRAAVSHNVADLMVHRLRRLPSETVDCLRLASCLGGEFDLASLVRLAGKPAGDVGAAMWKAVEERLVLPQGDGHRLVVGRGLGESAALGDLAVRYQFAHDRVQQAIYSLLDEDARAATHLRVGRLVLEDIPAADRGARVFDFIDHMNLGRRLVTSADERRDLADLNHAAGERARRAAAYAAAVSYLETSLGLLSREEWAGRPDAYFACCRMHAECVFLSGHVERASALCEELFGRAHDKIARASAYCLKASILEHQSLLAEACDTIRIALRDLDVELPTDHAAIDREIGAGIGKMQGHLAKTPIEDLVGLPAMTDRVKIATMDLLFQIIPPASQWHPPLFILAELIIFDLTLTYGTTPASSKNFVDCGIVLNVILRDSAAAYRMGRAAFAHLERHSPTPLESPVNFVFGCFISQWGAHYGEGLEALARSHQRGIELGDVQHAAYAIVHRALRLFFAGRDLAECKAQTDRAEGYCREAKAVGQETAARILQRALAQTDTGLGPAEPSDEAFIEEIRKTGNAHFLLVLGQTQTMVHFLLGDVEAATRWEAFAGSFLGAGNGTFPVPDHYLLRALLVAKKVGRTTGEEREALLASLAECQEQLRVYAEASPWNYTHKYKLASAEIARARGESVDEVLRLHGEALAAAGDDFVHLRALANELLAELWREKGHTQLAKGCIFEAYYLYRRWGARAKLRQMEREHAAWLVNVPLAHELSISRHSTHDLLQASSSRETVEANSLDLSSALKASHAVSSEVRPDRLYAVLMDAIIENAGAQHGFLVVDGEDDEELVVAARASVDDERKPATRRRVPLSQCEGIAQEIVRYAARTRETVVLDDAREDPLYGDDPHVVGDGVKSVLCLPVLNQGKLVAILYVENNVVTHAFTPRRLGVLHVIAGQAAISIANAALYESLERRVADRTRELTERNREVSALLNSMHQGVFTIDDKLRVQPQYSAHLRQLVGPREIQGSDCMDLLFRGSTVGPESLKTMRSALLFSFDVPVAVAEANLSHMAHEFARPGPDGTTTSLEVEWTPVIDQDETVRKMLVTVRDVTVIKQLRASSAQAARELDIVGQILDAGVDRFRRFCSSARALMRENRTLLQSQAALVRATLDAVLRDMHTVKGNARMLGLSHVANAVHAAEDRFQHDRQRSERVIDRGSLVSAVDTVLDSIDGYEWVCERKLGDAMRPRDLGGDRAWEQIAAQIAGAKRGSVGPAEALAAVERVLRDAGSVAMSDVVHGVAKTLPVVAQELGKVAPTVDSDLGDVRLTGPWSRVMSDVLVHAFQNSLDHGIEGADERKDLGKVSQGKILLRAERAERGLRLRLADDGRGIDLAALRERTGDATGTDEAVAAAAFRPGVSTAAQVTSISGRGVGLDAVRSFIRDRGGDVAIVFTGPLVGGRRAFELVITLPEDAVVTEGEESASRRVA